MNLFIHYRINIVVVKNNNMKRKSYTTALLNVVEDLRLKMNENSVS